MRAQRRPRRALGWPWGLVLVALSWLAFLALLWGLGLVSITPAAPTLPTWP